MENIADSNMKLLAALSYNTLTYHIDPLSTHVPVSSRKGNTSTDSLTTI